MLHSLITTWFHWVEQWGYLGIFALMALESSIVPVPSEIVMPPAAFWAAQGKMNFWLVVASGTAGSWCGSAVSYWVAQWAGLPIVQRYGKYFLLSPEKVALAEGWVRRYGAAGVFVARLLPVIRHLISIPAGVFRMPFARFSGVTVAGAGLWCLVLSWFGRAVIGDHPELLQSPEAMMAVIKARLQWFVLAVVVLGVLYALAMRRRSPAASRNSPVRPA
jgi:membrane protein DedA with SNARE-associated domain